MALFHSDTTQSTVQQSTETLDTVTSHTPTDLPFHASESFQTFEHHRVWPGFASLQGSYGSGDSTNNERGGGDLSQFNATGSLDPLEQSHVARHPNHPPTLFPGGRNRTATHPASTYPQVYRSSVCRWARTAESKLVTIVLKKV
jgi:hypothetical protein